MSPADAQTLLRLYVAQMNSLAQNPRFYNTLTGNCTTLVFDIVRVIYPGLPMDSRVIVSGYLPNHLYDLGAVDTSIIAVPLHDEVAERHQSAFTWPRS